MNKATKLLLIGIVILAAALRLYRLTQVPPGVNRDEASIGVTAYSLMTTGRDEYGRFLPLSFESFGDWKLPLYIYTTIPFVKIFGLSELAVRLPSALAGVASVAAIYFLAYALFVSEPIALLAALSLALMPWHIHISRVESEAIVAVLFTILGSISFLKAIKEKSLGRLILSAVLFGATYYTYHGNHVFTSLLLIGIAGIYRDDIIKIPKWWAAVGTGSLLVLIILSVTFSADHTKIGGISIFGDPTVIHNQIELPRLLHDNPDSLPARVIHNRFVYAVIAVSQNYLKSYGPDFLFIRGGGNKAHNILGYGNLHPIDAIFLVLGVTILISAVQKKSAKFILWWIAIGGVAAAITKDAPHSNRMLAVVPSFAIAVAAGTKMLYDHVPARMKRVLIVTLILAYAGAMTYYLDLYFTHFPKNEAANWGYAYQKLTPVLMAPTNAEKNVIMTHPQTSPYIFILFYSGYSPGDYQKESKRYPISGDGFTDVSGFGRFSFRGIDWSRDLTLPNTLLVAPADEAPKELSSKIISTISLPDGSEQFVVIDTDK